MPAAPIVDAEPRMTPAESALIADAPINFSRMTAELVDELRPRGRLARILVRRVAVMAVRLERCHEHDQAERAHRVRHAQTRFREARLAEVDKAIDWIAHEPATNARILRQSPEGLARLIAMWRAIERELRPEQDVFRADLQAAFPTDTDPKHRLPDRVGYWDYHLLARAENLMGRRESDLPTSRLKLLTDMGYNDPTPDQVIWVKEQIAQIINDQIAELQTLLDQFDPTLLELDRAEAAKRALFDPSPEAKLARRHEAASERAMYRALWELRQIPAHPQPTSPSDPPEADDDTPETPTLGSFRAEVSTPDRLEITHPKPRTRDQITRRTTSLGSFRPGTSPPV